MWMKPFEPKDIWRRPNGSVLEPARHPMSAVDDLTNRPGHDLTLEIDHRSRRQECSPASGSVISVPALDGYPFEARRSTPIRR
ncbi:hypothetical protein, partial [Mycobacterium avium]|uniref:hypothetical protein n=3 Tax=Mycobacteriaceae TaxID=1762 RepID=UPI001E589F09